MNWQQADRSRRGERGALSVEYAISVVVVALAIVGSVEFTRAIWVHNTIAYAAREGARYAAVRSSDSEEPATLATIQGRVHAEAVGLDPAEVNVSASWQPSNNTGATVTVNVSYNLGIITPLIPIEAIPLSTSSRRVIVN